MEKRVTTNLGNKNIFGRIFIIVFFLMIAGGCQSDNSSMVVSKEASDTSYEVVDAQGTVVKLKAKPQRIVTFSIGTDEIVLGLVPPKRMAAINETLEDPKSSNVVKLAKQILQKIPRNPSVEATATLRPDLVIVPSWIPFENIAALRDLEIPVVVCETPKGIKDVRASVKLIAQAVGEPEHGENILAQMDAKIVEIEEKVARIPSEQKNKKAVLISIMASYGGSGCTFDDMCKYAGAVNGKALAGNKNGQSMSKEQLVALNPDFLFLPSYQGGFSSEDDFGQEYVRDPSLQTMTAVREKHICRPWARYIYNVSQNMVFGIQETAYVLYGDDFKQPHTCHISAVEEGSH